MSPESELDRASKDFLAATGEFVHQVRKAVPSKDGNAIVSKKNFFAFLALLVSVCSLGLAGASFYNTNYRLNDADLASLHQKVDQLNHARMTSVQISDEQRSVLTHTAQEIEHDVERNEKALTASDYAIVVQSLDTLGITSEEKTMFVDLPDLTTFSGAVPSDIFTVTDIGFKRYFQDGKSTETAVSNKILHFLDALDKTSSSTSLTASQNAEISLDEAAVILSNPSLTADQLKSADQHVTSAAEFLKSASASKITYDSRLDTQAVQFREKIKASIKEIPVLRPKAAPAVPPSATEPK